MYKCLIAVVCINGWFSIIHVQAGTIIISVKLANGLNLTKSILKMVTLDAARSNIVQTRETLQPSSLKCTIPTLSFLRNDQNNMSAINYMQWLIHKTSKQEHNVLIYIKFL